MRDRLDWPAVKDRIDLSAVAAALLGHPARREGHRLLWLCPFHDDHHPSFQVDPGCRKWRCWSCGIGGDAAELVMRIRAVAFPEAARIAAELSGIVTPSRTTTRPAPRTRPPASPTAGKPAKPARTPSERSSGLPMEEASSLVAEAAERLWKPEGTDALAYLHGRCLKDETIKAASLGWTPGVMIPTRDGDRCYRARGITIPWFDEERLALVKIRQPEGSKPKYAEAFRDRPRIFPGAIVIEPGRPLVIVEGEFDALLLGQELRRAPGLPGWAAVVTLGSTSNRPDLDARSEMLAAPVWFVATDADGAGDKAALEWPARAIRIRPPDPFNDWTEAAQAGIDTCVVGGCPASGGPGPCGTSWPRSAGDRPARLAIQEENEP
ncbi:MAG: CHC2 zinc finger domain-containing protein [Isosphaeraceae bacterium]